VLSEEAKKVESSFPVMRHKQLLNIVHRESLDLGEEDELKQVRLKQSLTDRVCVCRCVCGVVWCGVGWGGWVGACVCACVCVCVCVTVGLKQVRFKQLQTDCVSVCMCDCGSVSFLVIPEQTQTCTV
jgi:hypothetical protein